MYRQQIPRFDRLLITGLLAASLLVACGADPSGDDTPPPAGAIATWDGDGLVSLSEVEARLPQQRTPACRAARQADSSLDELLPCYREMAEDLAVERLVVAEIENLDVAVDALLEQDPTLHQTALLDAFYQRARQEAEISDEEIEAHYQAHQEDYRRRGRLALSELFRRHEDPSAPEATVQFLRDLKARAEAGENFATLAREYSHSETRQLDGRVGQLWEGELPPELEKIAFALADGEISEPIRVKRGAVLLHVRNVVAGSEPSLDDARGEIVGRLRASRVAEQVDARLAGLAGADDSSDARQQLLYRTLLESQDSRDVELQIAADEQARTQAVAELVDRRLRDEIERQVDAAPEKLRSYFDDNRALFQSPPRFRLQLWDLPFGQDPLRQVERMEALQVALEAGEIELAAAAAELGGTVRELDWQTLPELSSELSTKAQNLLLQVEAGDFTVPFQYEEALHLIRVEDREEPQRLEYEEVAGDVRQKYLQRFGWKLYRAAVEVRLEAAGFRFHEEAVRRSLESA